ncbi:MAG: hypothetical protein EBU90_29720 [Proteobacteria bacterium]|nr:hypothetical protein [Pseudomonadota bacterium]NBP16854.1 hypothetical protein [bacterium]
MSQPIKAVIDHIGRYIIGEVQSENESTITLKTPVILHVQPNPQTNQLQIQTFPLFFAEFINAADREKNIWTFSKTSTIVGEVVLDGKIVAQYNNLVNPSPIITPQSGGSQPEVIKLFED